MSKSRKPDTEYTVSPEARERQVLRNILQKAKEFYADPKNVKAFELWLAEQEANESALSDENASTTSDK